MYICNSVKFHAVDCLFNVLTIYSIDFDVYTVTVYRLPSYSDIYPHILLRKVYQALHKIGIFLANDKVNPPNKGPIYILF